MSRAVADALLHGALAIGVVVVGGMAARWISRLTSWKPAGPLLLIAAAPTVPFVPLAFSVSLDDLLPIVGLVMLAWRSPVPRLTSDRILLVVLVAVAVTFLVRIASALVNGGDAAGTISMLGKAVARPVLLVGIAAYAAAAVPTGLRQRFVALSLASVGTFEAVFGLLAFAVRLPGGAGLEAANRLTSLYGVCPGRINGTLGLSPNHLGAVFVVTLPFTVGLALRQTGSQRWAWGLAAGLQVAALVLTFTRSSILVGVAVTLVLLLVHRKVILLALVAAVSAAFLFVVLSVACSTPSGGHGVPGDPVGLVGDRFGDSNDRLALWYAAAHITADHPFFGVGLGQMAATVKAEPERYGRTPFGFATSSAHNTILLAGVETGFIGALAAAVINIGLGLVALRCAWRGLRGHDPLLAAAALAIGGFLVQGMVNNLFEVGVTGVLLALTAGGFAGRADPAEDRADPSGSPTTRDSA